MNTINVKSAVEAAKQLKATYEALTIRKSELLQEKTALQHKNAALYRMPLRRAEAKKALFIAIDQAASQFPTTAKWRDLFEGVAFPKGQRTNVDDSSQVTQVASEGPLNLRDYLAVKQGDTRCLNIGGAANFFAGAAELKADNAGRAYFFFGDVIKAKIDKHFDEFFPARALCDDADLGIDEKLRTIEANNAQIVALDAELETIAAQMSELESSGLPRIGVRSAS